MDAIVDSSFMSHALSLQLDMNVHETSCATPTPNLTIINCWEHLTIYSNTVAIPYKCVLEKN